MAWDLFETVGNIIGFAVPQFIFFRLGLYYSVCKKEKIKILHRKSKCKFYSSGYSFAFFCV